MILSSIYGGAFETSAFIRVFKPQTSDLINSDFIQYNIAWNLNFKATYEVAFFFRGCAVVFYGAAIASLVWGMSFGFLDAAGFVSLCELVKAK